MKRILAVTGVLSLALTLVACGEDDTEIYVGTTTETPTEAATMEESTPGEPSPELTASEEPPVETSR